VRILEVCPYDIRRPGGVQRHILDLSKALAGAGHEVVLLAPGREDQPAWQETDGYRILSAGCFNIWRLHGTAFEVTWANGGDLDALLGLHEARPFDVVHFHTLWTPFLPWQVFRRLAPRVPRRIATFHDTPPPTLSGRLTRTVFRVLSRLLSRKLDAAIAVSDSPAGHLRLAPACQFHRLPPCIDLAPLLAMPRPNRRGQPPTVLFIGRLEPRKGVLLLIKAFAQVRKNHSAARLLVCGNGEQAEAARALATRLGVAEAVTFTGALDEAGKNRLYAEADVFCAPSPYGESYGLVLAEAMAAGLPVVAAANSGYRTVLTGPGEAGLVEPGSATALAAGLDALLRSPDRRDALSRWGREEARRSDVTARLEDFLAVLRGDHRAQTENRP
jgi:phosphatidylinositol alpha-mannosyltransferase